MQLLLMSFPAKFQWNLQSKSRGGYYFVGLGVPTVVLQNLQSGNDALWLILWFVLFLSLSYWLEVQASPKHQWTLLCCVHRLGVTLLHLVSGSFFHPQPPSLLIVLSPPGSERKVLTKETWFSLLREWKFWKLQWEQFLPRPGSPL